MTNNKDHYNITSSGYENLLTDNYKNKVNMGRLKITLSFVLVIVLSLLVGYFVRDAGFNITRAFSIGSIVNPKEKDGEELTDYDDLDISRSVDPNNFDMDLYNKIVANLKEKYVDTDKLNDEELFEGSIKGLVESLDDKATVYFDEEEYTAYKESFSGQFEGIGVRLDYIDNTVRVVDVLENSPASEVGVEVGYIFYKVDGEEVIDDSIESIVNVVRGESGSTVEIVFLDSDTGEEVKKDIVRAPVKVESMRLVEVDDRTVIFEISRFTENTLPVWKAMWDSNVDQINSAGYENVIIDLRGNGGGFLDAAIYAANDFLPKGKLIVEEKSRITPDKQNMSTDNNPRLGDKNVVIMINGGTASASEILAGALRHHKGYKIVGTDSYGKGTVQNTYDIPETNGALKITTEYWLLPNGQRLDQETPIKPDVEIEYDDEANKEGVDNVLEEAKKQL